MIRGRSPRRLRHLQFQPLPRRHRTSTMRGDLMKARPKLFAYASTCVVFLATSIAAGAGEARVNAALTETTHQAPGPAHVQTRPAGQLRVAQCQSGRNDCLTRPQEQCGPGLNDCLSRGQANCNVSSAAPSVPDPDTAGIEKALQNPNLSPEQRGRLENAKRMLVAASANTKAVVAARANARYSQCLREIVNQCRAAH